MRALIELLDDDSPDVLATVRDELCRGGPRATAALRRAAGSHRARLRARARSLLGELERREVLRRLVRHACRADLDLERALYLLGRLDRPDFDARPYERALDAMGREAAKRAAAEEDDLARPMVLTQYLGNELGYIGSEVDYDHPDNIHLHRAIVRKRGMPLTLAAIYLFVARRAGIRAAVVPLPGHVLLRLYSSRRTMLVDPFQGGRLRTRADCLDFLAQHGLVPRPEWFHDAPDRMLFQRHLLNLMNSSQVRGLHLQARALHRIAGVVGRVGLELGRSPGVSRGAR